MITLKILVFEDHNDVASGWARSIHDAYPAAEVEIAGPDSYERLLKVTNRRRLEWRKDGHGDGMIEQHEADGKNVVVVDYDLLEYSTTSDTTGSRLAYLLRCFTTCGFIVMLNARGPNVFDLSLSSPIEDFADLHIDGRQLGNPGLWGTDSNGYRPWYWPVIPSAAENFERCVSDVRDNFTTPILEYFGLNRVIEAIPWRVHDFLAAKGKPVEKVTFEDFAGFSPATKEAKDELTLEQLWRVAAARLQALLNSTIQPDQNTLVDAPHLVSRFPSLLKGGGETIGAWNALCDPTGSNMPELLDERLASYLFTQPHWLWRPAWYWPEIRRDEGIEEVRDPWKAGDTNAQWVFCENVSKFLPVDVVQTFRALVSPPYMKRYLLTRYSAAAATQVPQLRSEGTLDPLEAAYVPEVMLSY